MERLDELRKTFPHLGFAVYALEPGGSVIFEVYDGDDTYSFKADTVFSALEEAFPTPVALSVFD